MSDEVEMTFWVASALHDEFNACALKEQRNAAQVLRELMREYFQRHEQPVSLISDSERRRRQSPIDDGFANVESSGCSPSVELQERAKLSVEGHISMEEFANDR